MLEAAAVQRKLRRGHGSAAVGHWRKFLGEALAQRLKLRCTLIKDSVDASDAQLDGSCVEARVILRISLSALGAGLHRVWDVVRCPSQFRELEQRLLGAGLGIGKLASTIHLHGVHLIQCLERWLTSVLVHWQREERWGTFMMFRRRLTPEKVAAVAQHMEWFFFDPLPGHNSFQALLQGGAPCIFSSAVKRVEQVRAAQLLAGEEGDFLEVRRRDSETLYEVKKQELSFLRWGKRQPTELRQMLATKSSYDLRSTKSGRIQTPPVFNWLETAIARTRLTPRKSFKGFRRDSNKSEANHQDGPQEDFRPPALVRADTAPSNAPPRSPFRKLGRGRTQRCSSFGVYPAPSHAVKGPLKLDELDVVSFHGPRKSIASSIGAAPKDSDKANKHIRNGSDVSMFSCGSDLFHFRFSKKKRSSEDFTSMVSYYDTDIDYDYDAESVVESFLGRDDETCFTEDESNVGGDDYQLLMMPDRAYATARRLSIAQEPPAVRLSSVGQAVHYSVQTRKEQLDMGSCAPFHSTVDLSSSMTTATTTTTTTGYGQDDASCFTPISIPDTDCQRHEFLQAASAYTHNLLRQAATKLKQFE